MWKYRKKKIAVFTDIHGSIVHNQPNGSLVWLVGRGSKRIVFHIDEIMHTLTYTQIEVDWLRPEYGLTIYQNLVEAIMPKAKDCTNDKRGHTLEH